jgi:tetratricopeptide (TPR) repeat protein
MKWLLPRLVVLTMLFTGALSWADSAQEMISSGRIDDAIATLNGKLSSTPSDAASSNLLCRAYYELEDWDRAESSCKRAVAVEPDNSAYHLWLGRVYGEKADRASILSASALAVKVREEFEHAVQLNPADVDARVNLAEFYFLAPSIMGGSEQKARALAQSMGSVDPSREHWIYARIAEQKKDLAGAEREYEQSIQLDRGGAQAWLSYAEFCRRQKRIDDMEQALVKVSQSSALEPDVWVEAAAILYHSGRNFSLATELLQRYLKASTVEAAPAFKARYLLGLLLEKEGDRAAAAEQYRASLSLAKEFGVAQQALTRVAP